MSGSSGTRAKKEHVRMDIFYILPSSCRGEASSGWPDRNRAVPVADDDAPCLFLMAAIQEPMVGPGIFGQCRWMALAGVATAAAWLWPACASGRVGNHQACSGTPRRWPL